MYLSQIPLSLRFTILVSIRFLKSVHDESQLCLLNNHLNWFIWELFYVCTLTHVLTFHKTNILLHKLCRTTQKCSSLHKHKRMEDTKLVCDPSGWMEDEEAWIRKKREGRFRSPICLLNTTLSKDPHGAYLDPHSILVKFTEVLKIHRGPREVGSRNKFFTAFVL